MQVAIYSNEYRFVVVTFSFSYVDWLFEGVWHGNKKILTQVLAHAVELRISCSVWEYSAMPFCFDPRMIFLNDD